VVAIKLLDVMLNDTRYAPNAASFAAAVSVVANGRTTLEDGQRLVQVVEAQLPQIKIHSPIVDYVRLLAELTLARYVLIQDDHIALLVEESEALRHVQDPAARAACFAWLLRMFARLTSKHVDDSWGLKAYARSELDAAVEKIFAATAEQGEAVKDVIHSLAGHDLPYVEELISRVNTQWRRDHLYEELIAQILVDGTVQFDTVARLGLAVKLLGKIAEPYIQRRLSYRTTRWLAGRLTSVELAKDALKIAAPLLSATGDADLRVTARASLYCGVPEALFKASLGTDLLSEIDAAWQKTTFSDRIDCSFALASQMYRCNPTVAAHYFDEGTRLARTPQGLIASVGPVARRLLDLAVRSCAALDRANVGSVEDWDRLWSFVAQMPTKGDQALLTAMAALHVAKGKNEKAASIVSERLKPLLRDYMGDMEENPTEREVILGQCAPALWMQHSASSDEFICKLDSSSRDDAYNAVIDFLLEGRIPGDAWQESSRRSGRITYEVATDVVAVLGKMSGDVSLARGCEALLGYLRDRQADVRLNRNQRAEILRHVARLIREKLPEPLRGIKHEGYVVLLEGNLYAAEGSREHPEWERLVIRAEAIPNAADSVFVLGSLVEVIPPKYQALRLRCFEKAAGALPALGLLEDRLDRCEHLVKCSRDDFPARCKELLRSGLEESIEHDRPSIDRRRQKFLDLLYRVDSDVASAIASSTDSDPERRETRQELLEQIEDIKAGQAIRSADLASDVDVPIGRLGDICWTELGYLNATGVCSRSASQNLKLLEACQEGTVETAYSITSFVIEAMSIRYGNTPQAAEYLRPLYTAMTEACEIALIAARTTERDEDRLPTEEDADRGAAVTYVGIGSREEAIDVITRWVNISESSYVKICDPYFKPEDMEILEVFGSALPQAEVTVLTSVNATSRSRSVSINDEFANAWQRLSVDRRPKYCRIIMAGIARNGLFGIHNRWIILDDIGIDLGTSSGALGRDRSHVISRLDPLTRRKCEVDVDEYLLMQRRYWMDERISYQVISLER
jgi:hypothetical protein